MIRAQTDGGDGGGDCGRVRVEGLDTPVAPGSTVGGCLLVNSIKAEVAARLTRAGIEPWAREVEIPGKGTWIRLQVGGFDTRDSARKRAIAWKAAGAIEGFVVVRSSVGQNVADESADPVSSSPKQQHPGEKP